MPLDTLNRRILAALQSNGRLSNTELAEQINLSASACHRRVRNLERSGVIERYVAVVNQRAIGKPSNVFVEISLESQREDALEAFEKAARDCPDILECYLMAGDADYLLRVAIADAEDYERFHRQHLSKFPAVARIRSSFALREVSRKTAIAL
ncbi:MAG: Lrp/AsnC family transcriptional regulator [Alphaproteobacteria bacterium]|jgi:Lrp/AsnC family leucine-responsive transcriptional regulator|nr:AsnC family transcriptional regulator [Rhodospirillaceae bacterium]MDP6403672.1 Lrp/AsnC family transcriptional regulator [Alphaproteobacteria bacterium]MDP6624134.1 Lrp/AsnC family transcriptional regulator [Alphaproteobacteria bacterium]|tara:strand:+ start:1278 stop:1736 length:459 start_codon:yes stop_codon:yes gene_type:complete